MRNRNTVSHIFERYFHCDQITISYSFSTKHYLGDLFEGQ